MTASLIHRGPDSEGRTIHQDVGLGIRRLRVIDLVTGDQPVFNEDGSVALVLNGEIYNYRELAKELEGRGHRFRSQGDTEVVVHAYEEWGPSCLERFHGMFALAIHDRRGRRPSEDPVLFLARDRMGVKPLYYHQERGALCFASEVRALLAGGTPGRETSVEGIYSYLLFGSVQEPLTLVDGVLSLPPGHLARWTPERGGGSLEISRYWTPPPAAGASLGGARVVDGVADLLAEAVRMRLVADVPLGAFLSGGIDSGAVVSLMASSSSAPVRTFTVSFEEREYDEWDLASLTARRAGTDHTRVPVTGREVLSDLPRALASQDQPSIDGLNTYYVSKAARGAGLTVALSGVGGDELFGGYKTFHEVPRLRRLEGARRFLGPVGRSAAAWMASVGGGRGDRGRKMAAFFTGDVPFGHPYFLVRSLFLRSQALALLRPAIEGQIPDVSPWTERVAGTIRRAGLRDAVGEVSDLECAHYLVSTLLRDTDQASMAHSLEVRVPLVDHALVEAVLPLRGSLKMAGARNGSGKPLLVKSLGDALPREIVDRRKSFFLFPWERWLRRELAGEVESTLLDLPEPLRDVLDPAAVTEVWEAFRNGRTNWARPWSLFVLARWTEKNLGTAGRDG